MAPWPRCGRPSSESCTGVRLPGPRRAAGRLRGEVWCGVEERASEDAPMQTRMHRPLARAELHLFRPVVRRFVVGLQRLSGKKKALASNACADEACFAMMQR